MEHSESPVIRLPALCRRLGGVSKATIYRWERNDPSFPKRVKLGERITAWRSDQISAWIEARSAASGGAK